MLDLKYVVENREAVLAMLASRGQGLAGVQAFPGLAGVDPWALDAERRALIQEVEQLRHRQRVTGEEIARTCSRTSVCPRWARCRSSS